MRRNLILALLIISTGSLAAQTSNGVRTAARTVIEGQPATLRLAPRVTTTIRLPEPVNSVVVGDPTLFQAEYSPDEPLTVFVRPVVSNPAPSNLVVSTTRGRQFIFLLRALPADDDVSIVDLFVTCRPAGTFFVEGDFPTAVIPETVDLESPPLPETRSAGDSERNRDVDFDELLERQRTRKLEELHGEGIRVAIGPVLEKDSRLIVSFSVLNSQSEAVELVPPQVQLAGRKKSGIFKRTRWVTMQQLPVEAYAMTHRIVPPGGRVDGGVVFERPPIKQSAEGLLLQIADSAAIDRPTLAPISFRATEP